MSRTGRPDTRLSGAPTRATSARKRTAAGHAKAIRAATLTIEGKKRDEILAELGVSVATYYAMLREPEAARLLREAAEHAAARARLALQLRLDTYTEVHDALIREGTRDDNARVKALELGYRVAGVLGDDQGRAPTEAEALPDDELETAIKRAAGTL